MHAGRGCTNRVRGPVSSLRGCGAFPCDIAALDGHESALGHVVQVVLDGVAVVLDHANQRRFVIPWPPLRHDDALTAPQVRTGADRMGLAADRILRLRRILHTRAAANDVLGLLGHLLIYAFERVLADSEFTRPAEMERQLVVDELVARDHVVLGVGAVGFGPGLLCEIADRATPEVDAALVGAEGVGQDAIGLPMLDVDAAALQAVGHLAVALDDVLRDQRILRVTAPDAADRVLDEPVAPEDVSE